MKGTIAQFWAPFVLQDITKETVMKSVNWVEGLEKIDKALAESTYLIFEVLCTVSQHYLKLYGRTC